MKSEGNVVSSDRVQLEMTERGSKSIYLSLLQGNEERSHSVQQQSERYIP